MNCPASTIVKVASDKNWVNETFEAVERFARHAFGLNDGGGQALLLVGHPVRGLVLDKTRVATYADAETKVVLVQPDATGELGDHIAELSPLRASRSILNLKSLLGSDGAISANANGRQPSSKKLRALLNKSLGASCEAAIPKALIGAAAIAMDLPSDAIRRQFTRTVEKLFNSNCLASWRLALDLVACESTLRSHNRQNKLDLPEGQDAAGISISDEWRARRFIEACSDLSSALSAGLKSEAAQHTILVLDDRSPQDDDQLKLLETVVKDLMPGFRLAFLNPASCKDAPSLLEVLCNYQTILDRTRSREARARLAEFASELRQARFVLVDQLFLTNGIRKFRGPALIRGVNRFYRDFVKLSGEQFLVEIIALSKSSDVDRIQEALRAGATEYIVKSRLLALPAVLARAARGSSTSRGDPHRNFRRLYDLPNETIGLLRNAFIPSIPFHLGATAQEPKEMERPKEIMILWDHLLAAVPKPDLHIHVGSCMSPNFLIASSIVSLLRPNVELPVLRRGAHLLRLAFTGIWKPTLDPQLPEEQSAAPNWSCEQWMKTNADQIRATILTRLDGTDKSAYRQCRALLHAQLGIADFLDKKDCKKSIAKLADLDVVLFALRLETGFAISKTDFIRLYILLLAHNAGGKTCWKEHNLLACIFLEQEQPLEKWIEFQSVLYNVPKSEGLGVISFRNAAWRLDSGSAAVKTLKEHFRVEYSTRREAPDYMQEFPTFEEDSISFTIGSGLRSSNLKEYLVGFEFTGAEHLRHPLLMHLFAQQALVEFIRKGAFYVELRGSPDGYIDRDQSIEFSEACELFRTAIAQAQELLYGDENDEPAAWIASVLSDRFSWQVARERFVRGEDPLGELDENLFSRRLPTSVNLIFVGKRHKSLREMIAEAAATAVLKPALRSEVKSAATFARGDMLRCRVVGFDLAGQEVGNPPERFVEEFRRLSRFHVPLTVHAGENASSQYVEDAILELRARRIGHGLSLADDSELMARVREERVCIELCPVSNHQTSHFADPNSEGGRKYPLATYLKQGLIVTIGTDNPTVSHTNLVKEYYQASYCMGAPGLSLWDALRIMRMGLNSGFLQQSERRALLEMAEQHLFDLFSEPRVVAKLKHLVAN